MSLLGALFTFDVTATLLVRDRPILGEVVVAAAVEQKCIEKIEHVEEIEYDERVSSSFD